MYEYGYYETVSAADTTASLMMMIFMAVVYGGLFLFLIANYVLNALAWHKVAKKEGLNTPWLAWIPVADNLIVGGVASKIDKLSGKERSWGKLLLILSAVMAGGMTVGYVIFFVMIVVSAVSMAASEALGVVLMVVTCVLFYALIFAAALTGQASSYLRVICVYKYFDYVKSEKMFKYMLLYLMVPFAGPICIMKTLKNEEDDYIEVEVPVIEE